MKVGVGITDVMCGMYATVGILAALRHQERTGEGQQIDVALVDSQIAWLISEGVNYLTSGQVPIRRGNGHPNIKPYGVYETTDGHVILAVGNDSQFGRFAEFLGLSGLTKDPRFSSNPARLQNREALDDILIPAVQRYGTQDIIENLEALKVPVGPVQDLKAVFDSDQVAARGMQIDMETESGPVHLIGNPLKFSRTPVTYRHAPRKFGADSDEILSSDTPFEI